MKASHYSGQILRILSLLILIVFCITGTTYATHMRAGNIIVEKIGVGCTRSYMITIIAYIDTESGVPFGGSTDFLYFGDGTRRITVPEIVQGTTVPGATWTMIDPVRKVARVTYSIRHDYAGADEFIISYIEVNRNQGILNMDQSVDTPFYLETKIKIDPFLGCSSPAKITVPPVDRACSGIAWTHNPGAFDDVDEDSISYKFVTPFSNVRTEVLNYRDPNNPAFYTDYATGNETDDGPPTFTIDPQYGDITWDAPGAVGEYNIAFHVIEWRRGPDGRWYEMGYVRRDMQIIVEDDCNNRRPELEIPDDICVEAGELIDTDLLGGIIGTDPDGDQVMIEAFAQILGNEFPGKATLTPAPAFRSSPTNARLLWQTDCSHVKDQPYQVVFKVTDNPTNGSPMLATFKSMFIRVVGPKPVWNDRTVNPNRSVTLKWDPYACQNAETMQVWRRVDSVAFEPDDCQTGMPPNLGYQLIQELPVQGNTEYVDENLAPGARYCYRLVAIFPSPKGGESIVSSDTCVGPILDDSPVITNVSVLSTGVNDGTMKVKWFRPPEALLPPPYTYEVYRSEGFTRGNDSTLVATITNSGALADSIVDASLDTETKVYTYSVTAYAGADQLGSSAPASSVRLETQSQIGRIVLSWRAEVPWSNQIPGYRHKIYRGSENSPDEDMVLIHTLEVTTDGLTYIDSGQYDNTPLVEGTVYCYRVETLGSYGNPDLPDTLRNFSQRICTQPGDSIPPCAPVLDIALKPCEEYIDEGLLCGANTFENNITWTRPDDPQCSDIRFYEVWVSGSKGGDFVFVETIPGTATSYLDEDLPSFARCYKLRAIDRSGNKGEFSNEICGDNCPYYELPNVFSPNGDSYNDFFSAFSTRGVCQEVNCPPDDALFRLRQKCARFVDKVKFTAYNRWGQEVFEYESGGERTIYIDWDGKDKNGEQLAPAVYFYIAEVTFDVVDPRERVKVFKGWVHLLDGQQ